MWKFPVVNDLPSTRWLSTDPRRGSNMDLVGRCINWSLFAIKRFLLLNAKPVL